MDSKLQIISGVYRGRKLYLPAGARPTQNRARIALFNMIGAGIIDSSCKIVVWDAFAGSGAFGIECLSRYPGATVIFTDIAPVSVTTVKKNLAHLSVDARATVVQADALTRIGQYAPHADLIFVDPPYADHAVGASLVRKIGKIARSGTVLIWEQDSATAYMPDENTWKILRNKSYGRACFLILQHV